MRSTPFFSRARPNRERGYALISALVLAILYFGLMELLLVDSARELGEARRFRARIVAETLAENAAELAALQITSHDSTSVNAEDWQGTMKGSMTKNGETFVIEAEGVSTGITTSRSHVIVKGRVLGQSVRIQYTQHAY